MKQVFEHGTWRRYKYNHCLCDLCKKAMRIREKELEAIRNKINIANWKTMGYELPQMDEVRRKFHEHWKKFLREKDKNK